MKNRKSRKGKRRNSSRILSIRLPVEHPVFKETDRAKVVEEALDLYYGLKALSRGQPAEGLLKMLGQAGVPGQGETKEPEAKKEGMKGPFSVDKMKKLSKIKNL